jgi:pimeloyl-ACP methyl ester carboxylesterase
MMADNWRGWELRRAGPENARRKALLLPGGLCTAVFYADQLADPRLATSGVCFIAATPPGFGGRPAPEDVRVESYARLTAELGRSLGCHLVVGHSYSANVVIEMAAAGLFNGPVVLLSPIFSREDEEKEFA